MGAAEQGMMGRQGLSKQPGDLEANPTALSLAWWPLSADHQISTPFPCLLKM